MSSEFSMGRFSEGFMIRLVGRATMRESPAFRTAVESSLERSTVVFDATRCDYLDSTFLGCLIGIKKACELSPQRRFLIAADKATRLRLFAISSLDRYFEFIDAAPEPLGQLLSIDIESVAPDALGHHIMRCHEWLAAMGGREAAAFRAVADRLAAELGARVAKSGD